MSPPINDTNLSLAGVLKWLVVIGSLLFFVRSWQAFSAPAFSVRDGLLNLTYGALMIAASWAIWFFLAAIRRIGMLSPRRRPLGHFVFGSVRVRRPSPTKFKAKMVRLRMMQGQNSNAGWEFISNRAWLIMLPQLG
jgi:hypothetical protein